MYWPTVVGPPHSAQTESLRAFITLSASTGGAVMASRSRGEGREAVTVRRDPIMIPERPFPALSGASGHGAQSSVHAGQQRRTGIEPAGDAERRSPVLKTVPPG
jgi:hypothetical protein